MKAFLNILRFFIKNLNSIHNGVGSLINLTVMYKTLNIK